jgi:hypothetical protein
MSQMFGTEVHITSKNGARKVGKECHRLDRFNKVGLSVNGQLNRKIQQLKLERRTY